jgi:hypothetical protein
MAQAGVPGESSALNSAVFCGCATGADLTQALESGASLSSSSLSLLLPGSRAVVSGRWAGASPRFCPLKLIDFCADFYSTNVIVR